MLSPLRNRFGSRLREPFGKAALVVAVIALVFAMLGGAYAASSGGGKGAGKATISAKAKRGPRGPRGPKGATGPAGAAGPAGAKGDSGAPGANGKDGANGANGQSVTATAFVGSKGGCGEGGVELISSSGTNFVCNGKKGNNGTNGANGSPWTAGGTLPANSTETGVYGVSGTAEPGLGFSVMAEGDVDGSLQASFTVPVTPTPTFVFVPGPFTSAAGGFGAEAKGTGNLTDGSKLVTAVATTSGSFVAGAPIAGTGIPVNTEEPTTIKKVISATELELSASATATSSGVSLTASGGCPGVTAGVPKAASGKFCVYGYAINIGGGAEVPSASVITTGIDASTGNPAVSPAGALLKASCEVSPTAVCYGKGLWAVTG